MMNRMAFWIAWSAMLSICTSCNRIAATSLTHETETAMEHEHFPVHWPENIFAATARLVAMNAGSGDVSMKEGIPLEKELIDLLRWLPTLAADSDLKEDAFNKIDAWSARFVPALKIQIKQGRNFNELFATDGLSTAISELKLMVDLESERKKLLGG